MQTQVRTAPIIQVRSQKKTRRYVVAYQCDHCKRNGILDDFEGEYDITCTCGKKRTVSLTEGIEPDWYLNWEKF